MLNKLTNVLRSATRSNNEEADTATLATGTESEVNVPDLITILDLTEWYSKLTPAQREKLYEYSTMFGLDGTEYLLDRPMDQTSQTQQGYLKGVGSTAIHESDYEFAEMVLLEALAVDDVDASDRHFVYNALIKLYYRKRNEWDGALDNCIRYCKEDIEHFEAFATAWREDTEGDDLPQIPAFKRLAIIYEKQDQYEEALAICDQALEHGLDDGTKGGFEGRKERIEKKIE